MKENIRMLWKNGMVMGSANTGMWSNSFIYWVSIKYSFSSNYVPGTVYGASDTTMNTTSKNSEPYEAYIVAFWVKLLE